MQAKRNARLLVLFACAGALGVAPRAFAAQQTMSVANDTFIDSLSTAADNNNGGTASLFVGVQNGGGVLRAFIQFNMLPGLQGRVTVSAVDLAITFQAPFNASKRIDGTVSLNRMLQNWTPEGGGVGAKGSTYTTGQACTSGPTWNHAGCPSTTWANNVTGAGDPTAFSSTLSASFGTSGLADGAVVNLTASQLVNDVQSFMDGTASNYGWRMSSSTETSATHPATQMFWSKQGTSPPTLTITYSCKSGFTTSGNNCTTCSTTAQGDCGQPSGFGSCVDSGPPSTTYSCSCNSPHINGNASDGNPGCIIGCTPTNHCLDGGDSSATCSQINGGYSCTCTTANGYSFNGTTCVKQCTASTTGTASDPCGGPGKGTCTSTGTGTWTCSCGTGYAPTAGSQPTCGDYNACTAAAVADCTTYVGNACVDEAPPSITYHCTCGNAAFVTGPGLDGGPACVNKNECIPNHCLDGGDTTAVCSDHPAPAVGYDCVCSSNLWMVSPSPSPMPPALITCVDRNECASGNPCLNGTCTNIPNGGGYSCACNPGFTSTGGQTPVCVIPGCDAAALIACVTSAPGNTCINESTGGYRCNCMAPGYRSNGSGLRCRPTNPCTVNTCVNGGDSNAQCSALPAPATGYDCTCSPGWTFDGTTCVDINECFLSTNPCGTGACTNLPGGYRCDCPNGYVSSAGLMPTCVLNVNASTVRWTVRTSGGCTVGAGGDPGTAALLLVGLLLLLVRRRASAARGG